MEHILVWSAFDSERLRFALSVLLTDCLGVSFEVTSDENKFRNSSQAKICYHSHRIASGVCFIPACGLLAEQTIVPQRITVADCDGLPAFFFVPTSDADFSFDLLSLVFYLVSRYEEYLPDATRDAHSRFTASQSVAFQNDFLQKPLVQLWAQHLKKNLLSYFPQLTFELPEYHFQPTYDIDMAWAFLHKGFLRTAAGFANDLLRLRWQKLARRVATHCGFRHDDYDTFEKLDKLHRHHDLCPIFFFLVGNYDRKYDKNTSFRVPIFQKLVQKIAAQYPVGLHPSYQSNYLEKRLDLEKKRLESIVFKNISKSRQHFLKLSLAHTYRRLIAAGLSEDYTMGYAEAVGFRASTALPFYWYDLENEKITSLRVHSFQLMDVSLRQYQACSPEAAKVQINELSAAVRSVGGEFVSIWHNSSFAASEGWDGWADVHDFLLATGK